MRFIRSSARANRLGRVLAVVACLAALAPPAGAVNITVNTLNEGMNPDWDLSGDDLRAVADAAAWHWNRYLPSPGTVHNLEIWWDDDVGDDRVAYHSGGEIHVSTDYAWYIDQTPYNHDEFDFDTFDLGWSSGRWVCYGGQFLARDFDASDLDKWFEGNPPGLMEIGYCGRSSDPNVVGRLDLFSTVIHEIGHALGVADDPVELSPAWVGGQQVTLKHTGLGGGHLTADTALMRFEGAVGDIRRMPSAVDIMAAAVTDGATPDLPRQDFYKGGLWHHGPSWLGGLVPHADDWVYIRTGDDVRLTANAAAGQLFISGGSLLRTDGHGITVGGRTRVITSLNAAPSEIIVSPAGANWIAFTDTTLDGGILRMKGATVILSGTTTTRNNDEHDAEIKGWGTVRIDGTLVNNGVIQPDGVLTFDSFTPAAKFDLDGVVDPADSSSSEDGVVNARYGSIVFDGGWADATFDGLMTIGAYKTVTLRDNWTMNGRLEFDGTPTGAASLDGAACNLTISGRVDVDGLGRVATEDVVFESKAYVTLDFVNDRLLLDTKAYFEGGTYKGNGTIEQQADISVIKPTTIGCHNYDWGNSTIGDVHTTRIIETGSLTVNANTTGTLQNEYRGTIDIKGAELHVNLPGGWVLPYRDSGDVPGVLACDSGDTTSSSEVTGTPLTVKGFVHVNGGRAKMYADFITTSTATVTVRDGADLELRGHNTLAGGSFTGDGRIDHRGNTSVTADTTVAVRKYDLDGVEGACSTTTIQPGVTFTITSPEFEPLSGSFDGAVVNKAGRLEVNTVGVWTLGTDGTLDLRNTGGRAVVSGAPVQVDGRILTSGGINEMRAAVRFGAGARVEAPGPDDVLRLRYPTTYNGGSYTGPGGISQDATAFINVPTTIDLGLFDMDGSKAAEDTRIELYSDLVLNVESVDAADNRYNGEMEVAGPARLIVNTPTPWSMAGTLQVLGAPGTTFIIGGAPIILETDIYVDPKNTLEFAAAVTGSGGFTGTGQVVFRDQMSPGTSPAVVSAAGDVTFIDSAQLLIEIGGVIPGADHDQLAVKGDLAMDGTLRIRFDGYAPQQGDLFELIVVDGDVVDMLGKDDILVENLKPGFQYDARFHPDGVFRLTALGDGQLIPEPSTLTLSAVVALGCLARRKRRSE